MNLSRNDLNDSLDSLLHLRTTATSFRLALSNLAEHTASFAKALEDCARLKGTQQQTTSSSNGQQPPPFDPAQRLLAASGLHFISANLLQLLSITILNSFESPLSSLYDAYNQQITLQQNNYQNLVSLKTRAIRETELRNLSQPNPSRSRRHSPRDLVSFRRGLNELQQQVDQLESLKEAYYLQLAIGEREIWSQVAENISLVVKSEVEVFDRIASKPTSDPTLEWMTSMNPDPFDAYKPLSTINSAASEAPEIYSILDPLSNFLESRSPSRVRKSLDLSQSLGSLSHHPFDPLPPPASGSLKSCSQSSDRHSPLNSTNHWAARSIPTTPQRERDAHKTPPTSSSTQSHPPPPVETKTSSPIKSDPPVDPEATPNLPSTNSSLTITSPPSGESSSTTPIATRGDHPTDVENGPKEAHPQPVTRNITDSSLQVFIHDSKLVQPSSSSSCLDLPPPNSIVKKRNLASSIYHPSPSLSDNDLDNLLREQPPSGIDLSDSDL